jgi:crotonobetainyl-CoA:carnitine CoA-transferase CaiB-like acyl-CoA transferase
MNAPLHGIRVVDLTMVWAGPFGTRLLGDYGAEVIKVESPKQWDMLRSLGLVPRDVPHWYNMSAYFNHNNRNKYSLALELRNPLGREMLLKLCAASDVIVENYRADVMANLGLSYEDIRAVNPRIIYVSMPGHGKTGPESGYVAYGTNVEQLAGLVSLSGYEGGEPLKTGFSYGDPMAGTALPAAVAMALRQRNRTGEGTYVEIAQRENLTAFIGEYIVDYSMNGQLRAPLGNRHPHFAPHNRYTCGGEEQFIAIACENDAQFAALCGVIERPELADDPRFATAAARKANEAELDPAIEAWTSVRGHYDAMFLLQRAGVPAGAVLTVPELMADPQLRSRGEWLEQTHPDAGTWEMEAPPWRLPRTPGDARLPSPGFGDHNGYVFRDLLGLDEELIARLYAEGITADAPDEGLHQ